MPDYGQSLQFGYFLIPDAADIGGVMRMAHLADDLGLDLIGIQDHPYQRRFLDTWTLLTAVAMQTRHVRVFPDVASLPLRPPAVLAKAAASLDLLSGGRFSQGLTVCHRAHQAFFQIGRIGSHTPLPRIFRARACRCFSQVALVQYYSSDYTTVS